MASNELNQLLSGQIQKTNGGLPEGEVFELPNGGLEVTLPEDNIDDFGEQDQFSRGGHYENLVHYFEDQGALTTLGLETIDTCEADKESREEWELLLNPGS